MYSTAEHLRLAAKYLYEHGWTQGKGVRSDGSACILGALEVTGRTVDDIDKSVAVVREELYLQGWPHGISQWNDRPGRTKDEVMGLLQALALRCAVVEARAGE